MYRHVASSITSSTVTTPRAEEVSATSAVGKGHGTSAAGEGSGTSTAGRGPAVATTGAGSNAEVITPPNDGGGAASSSKTITTYLPLRPASVGGSRAT
jgi:hypothetical protein